MVNASNTIEKDIMETRCLTRSKRSIESIQSSVYFAEENRKLILAEYVGKKTKQKKRRNIVVTPPSTMLFGIDLEHLFT